MTNLIRCEVHSSNTSSLKIWRKKKKKKEVGGKNKAFANPWLDSFSQLEGFISWAWSFLFWPSSQGHVSGGLYFPKAVTQSIRSYELDHQAFAHLNFWATIPCPPPPPPAVTHDMMPLPLTDWEGKKHFIAEHVHRRAQKLSKLTVVWC